MSTARDAASPLIRPMLQSDVEAVMAIEEQVYSHGWTEGIFRDCLRIHYSCWVMLQNDKLIGYGVLSAAAGEAHILNIAVALEEQGRGYGRSFMHFLLQTAGRHGADIVFLEVRPSNVAAIRLYDAMGFHQVGVRRDYYPMDSGREDAVIMARSLDDMDL
ncbi:MAG: ribosomal protein S18-alanine N-acetyltransferase [Pseudomonadota bacterium]